jgi:phytoene synthase
MAAASTDSPLDWCRARYLVPGHPLTLTLPYAEPADRDALLALRALIGEIAAVPGDVSDAEVARRKLDWWRDALAGAVPHPVLEAFRASGAARRVPSRTMVEFTAAVHATIDTSRFETEAELDRHARGLTRPAVAAEAALVDSEGRDPGAVEALSEIAAAGYRVRLARDLVVDARHGRWTVPLELQAEFQVTRMQVADGEVPHRVRALLAHLAGSAVGRMVDARAGLSATSAWRHRHAVLSGELDRRLGLRLVRSPARGLVQRQAVSGPRVAFGLWREARRLRKAASN